MSMKNRSRAYRGKRGDEESPKIRGGKSSPLATIWEIRWTVAGGKKAKSRKKKGNFKRKKEFVSTWENERKPLAPSKRRAERMRKGPNEQNGEREKDDEKTDPDSMGEAQRSVNLGERAKRRRKKEAV